MRFAQSHSNPVAIRKCAAAVESRRDVPNRGNGKPRSAQGYDFGYVAKKTETKLPNGIVGHIS